MKLLKVSSLFFSSSLVLMGTTLLIMPTMAFAQHGGGGHGAPLGGGGLSSTGQPSGVGEKDELKDFHHAMEVQATSDQAAAFRTILKKTEAANSQLASLETEKDASLWAGQAADVKAAIDKARISTRTFVDGLSARQKAGLKEITGKIAKVETDLAGQEKVLEAIAGEGHDPAMGGRTESLAKALETFRNQQGRLAEEMGIVLSDSGEVMFRIPVFKNSAQVGGQRIAVSSSSVISQVEAENEANVYKIEVTQDLSDLQSNITEVLRAQVEAFPKCGERVELRNATLALAAPASVVVAQLYVEHWICAGGPETARELAQGTGSVEIRVTPAVEANGDLNMKTEVRRVEGDKFVGDLLKSGTLGEALQEKIALSMVNVIESANFKAMLPPTGAAWAETKSARFESTAGGSLGVALAGVMRMSDEQAGVLGNQLKERVAAQAAK
ncbi:MAG: hypothetical protein WAU58_01385 [Terriglobales bacterium]